MIRSHFAHVKLTRTLPCI